MVSTHGSPSNGKQVFLLAKHGGTQERLPKELTGKPTLSHFSTNYNAIQARWQAWMT